MLLSSPKSCVLRERKQSQTSIRQQVSLSSLWTGQVPRQRIRINRHHRENVVGAIERQRDHQQLERFLGNELVVQSYFTCATVSTITRSSSPLVAAGTLSTTPLLL
jgi:hypothetical protein